MRTAHRQAARGKRRWQADPDALPRVMRRTQPLTNSEILAEMLPIHDAMKAVDTGNPSEDDEARLLALGCAVRARGLAIDQAAGAELGDRVIAACEEAFRRKRKTGHFGFTGPERQYVRDAIDLWEQMLELSQPHEISAAGRAGAEHAAVVCARIGAMLDGREWNEVPA